MNRVRIRNSILLFVTAAIWGCAFVAQSVSMDYIGPFTMNGVRNIIGGMVLIPFILFRERKQNMERDNTVNNFTETSYATAMDAKKERDKMSVIGGIFCGIALALASMAQQIGISTTTVGKAGFITALYIVIVPIIGIFLGKKVGMKLGISIILSVVGLYLLCMSGSFSLTKGDTLVLICAVLFSFHILIVDHFSPKADGVKMSCIQFFVSGIICSIGMFIFEEPHLNDIFAAYIPILYAGVMSCGVGYTLQIIGQKGLPPTIASLIMSLESVFSVLAGWVILGQSLSPKEISGCILMFAAIVLAQLPERRSQAQIET